MFAIAGTDMSGGALARDGLRVADLGERAQRVFSNPRCCSALTGKVTWSTTAMIAAVVLAIMAVLMSAVAWVLYRRISDPGSGSAWRPRT
jgi:hypothetical protein